MRRVFFFFPLLCNDTAFRALCSVCTVHASPGLFLRSPQAGLQAGAMFRTAVMMAASLALTGAVVAHAYYLKHQFYPTVVYLTKSSPSMAVSTDRAQGGRNALGGEEAFA